MAKFIVVVIAALALVFYLHGGDASAAKVARCLEHAGASVTRSRFLEDQFSVTGDGQTPPAGLRKQLKEADNGMYDVNLAGDTGLLMVVGRGYSAAQVEQSANTPGGPGTAQGRGKIVMLWTGQPRASSRSTLDRCLR